jgi:hypothetical protein
MNIVTATNGRPDVAEVWCAAVAATLTTPHTATVLYQGPPPRGSCTTREVPHISATIGIAVDQYARGPVRMFLEEDMIPVRPWSVDDYPGRLVAAQGNAHGQPWPALLIKRDSGEPATAIVPQRFVREGGCPDWLPVELCEPAIRANAKVLGSHFIHIDKMYRREIPEAAAKNELLELLRQRFDAPAPAADRLGLGDLVASGLARIGITEERVSRALGRPCGCKERRAALNRAGQRLGLGG